jgi:AcrR family transcriptional regulator
MTVLRSRRRIYGGISAEERASARKQRFIDAGKTVFGKLGFQAAGVRDVCTEAGLTERYYYEAFGSMPKLFEAVYLEALDDLRQVLEEAALRLPEDPGTQLRSMIRSYFDLMKRDRCLARILILEIYGAAPAVNNLYELGVRQFAAQIEKIVASNALIAKPLDGKLVAIALVGATSALAMNWYLSGYKQPVSVMAENCFAIFAGVLPSLHLAGKASAV